MDQDVKLTVLVWVGINCQSMLSSTSLTDSGTSNCSGLEKDLVPIIAAMQKLEGHHANMTEKSPKSCCFMAFEISMIPKGACSC